MIKTFRHKGPKPLFEQDDASGVNPEHVGKLKNILATLHAAPTGRHMNLPGLHPLKGSGGTRRNAQHPFRTGEWQARHIPEMAVRIAKVFGGTEEGWLIHQAQYELAYVRRDRIKLKRLEIA